MSIMSKVFAATATLTLVGGVSAVGLLPAQAQTPSCSKSCYALYSEEYGTPFVLDVLRQGEKVGQPVILFRDSNTDPAEDFAEVNEDTVASYYAAGLVSEGLDYNYGTDYAYQLEYAPYGVESGLCVGVASTATNGTPVARETCGASSKTLWVTDYGDTDGAYAPLINGSDTNFADPYVLHYPGTAYPTDMPRAQLNTWGLQQYSDSTVFDNEQWIDIS